jgi:hypothetical protein
MPFADLNTAYKVYQPDYLLSISTSMPTKDHIQGYVDDLSKAFPDATVLLSGFAILQAELTVPSNVQILHQFQELTEMITFA